MFSKINKCWEKIHQVAMPKKHMHSKLNYQNQFVPERILSSSKISFNSFEPHVFLIPLKWKIMLRIS